MRRYRLTPAATRDLANIDAHFERLEAVSQLMGPAQLVAHHGSVGVIGMREQDVAGR